MKYVFEMVFEEGQEGITAISIVDEPAILENFIKLAKENIEFQFAVNKDQQIITGPVLIPNIKIFRSGRALGLDEDAYVYFKEETIRKLSEHYMEQERINSTTIDHEEKSTDFSMRESWIIEDPQKDKAAFYGFDLPKGTWMASFKVHNEEIWKRIKEGELNGFSIEAALGLNPIGEINMSEELVVEPAAGESKDDFMGRCVSKEMDAGMDQDQAVAVCINKWEQSADDRLFLSDEDGNLLIQEIKKTGFTLKELEEDGYILLSEDDVLTEEGEAISLLLSLGLDDADPEAKSVLDKGKYEIRYKYSGPRDSKNRPFCAEMLSLGLIYRKEDIEDFSFGTYKDSYNFFQWKGGRFCRHRFARLVFIKADDVSKRLPGSSALPKNYIPSDKRATSVNTK